MKLTSEQLVLVSYIDRRLIQNVITTDEMLEQLRQEEDSNQTLIGYMTKIVNRIK